MKRMNAMNAMDDIYIVLLAVGSILLWWAFWGTILGMFAARKNRNIWAWAIIGAFPWFLGPAIIIMCFLAFLCPKCKSPMTKKEWKGGHCQCGWNRAGSLQEKTQRIEAD